jgi:hypothetical protein
MWNEDAALRDFMANDGYPGDTPAYQARHAAPSFPTEPEPEPAQGSFRGPGTEPWECPVCHSLFERPGFQHEPCGLPSIFDAPDAATTHAKQTAQALIHEYQTFASQPGHWTADQSAAWIGQACAVLTELAK